MHPCRNHPLIPLNTEPISISVAAPTSGADVWILLQRHVSAFTSITEVDGAETNANQQHKAVKMALQSLEDTCPKSSFTEIALGSEDAVSPYSIGSWYSLLTPNNQLEYTTSTWILVSLRPSMTQLSLMG